MNPPPLPFGDPDQIRRDNNSAVKKGLLFGCGGCALLVALVMAGAVGIVFFVFAAVRSSEPYQASLRAAQASPELRTAIGDPVTSDWWLTGSVNWNNGVGSADIQVPVKGPNGSATIHTIGAKQPATPWTFEKMEATVEGGGAVIDLRR